MKVFAADHQQSYFSNNYRIRGFSQLGDILESFLKAYLPKYHQGEIRDTEQRVKDLTRESEELEEEIKDNSEKIEELENEIEEMQIKMESNKSALEETRIKLEKRKARLERKRIELQEI